MRPGYFRLRRCPLIYHQKSGQKRGGLMEIIQKTCPGYPGSIVVPLYTTRKTEQMETVAAYFFEKPPLTNRDILGCFSDWLGGNFSKSFSYQRAYPAGDADTKRGRHCEKYRPSFGTFCPKGIKSAPCLKTRNLYNYTNGKQFGCGHTPKFLLGRGPLALK